MRLTRRAVLGGGLVAVAGALSGVAAPAAPVAAGVLTFTPPAGIESPGSRRWSGRWQWTGSRATPGILHVGARGDLALLRPEEGLYAVLGPGAQGPPLQALRVRDVTAREVPGATSALLADVRPGTGSRLGGVVLAVTGHRAGAILVALGDDGFSAADEDALVRSVRVEG